MSTHHPGPSTQCRRSRQLMAKYSNTVSFDSFLFVDNVTNNKIVFKDVKKQYEPKQPRPLVRNQELQQQRQLQNLNECICTLKATKLFKMDSLRNKIFKSPHHSHNPSTHIPDQVSLQAQKRRLRLQIEMSITDLSVKQLRDCIQNPDRRINQQIIGLQTFSGSKLTKSQFLRLIKKIGKTSPKTNKHEQMGIKYATTQEDEEFPGEKQIRELGNDYLKNAMKNNNTYLINPNYEKDLYEKLYSACSRYKVNNQSIPHTQSLIKQADKHDGNDEGIFKPIILGQSMQKLQKKVNAKGWRQTKHSSQQRQILFAVQNNLLFDVQFLLMNKGLVHTQDGKGNTLLHLASKSRNLQLFTFLLKKVGPQQLQAKNNMGKTPLDLARIYGATDIVSLCQNYTPYS